MYSRISVITSIKTLLRNSAIFIIAYTTNAEVFYKQPYQTFLGLNLKAQEYRYLTKLWNIIVTICLQKAQVLKFDKKNLKHCVYNNTNLRSLIK